MAAVGAISRATIAGVGGFLGGIIGVAPAVWGATDDSLQLLLYAGLIGLPTGSILGYRQARRMRAAPSRDVPLLVLVMATHAAVLPGMIIGGVLAIGGLAGGLAGLFLFPLAVLYSFTAVVVTLPCAMAWAITTRTLPPSVMEGTLPPIRSTTARAVSVAVLVVLALLGAIPQASLAVSGDTCTDLGGLPNVMAWSEDGAALYVAVDDDSDLVSSVVSIDPEDGTAHAIQTVEGWVADVIVDGNGRPIWLTVGESSSALWTLDPDPVRIGSSVTLDDSRLAWFDGQLVTVRLDDGAGAEVAALVVDNGRVIVGDVVARLPEAWAVMVSGDG
jgi:hypothetical protein